MLSPFIITPYSYTPKQYGENGEVEYGWSNNIKELILQFYFQLTRTDEKKIELLENKLTDILYYLINNIKLDISYTHLDIDDSFKNKYIDYMILLYKIIGNTRDIVNGKGEYMLTYMMISVWYDFFPELSFNALHSLNCPILNSLPYGSWKDMKYFCQYIKLKKKNEEHPLIKECIQIINSQLTIDVDVYHSKTSSSRISLVSKWIPREKSKKFGWLFSYLAYHFFHHYIKSAKTQFSLINARLKCKIQYRKIISKLNKQLDTLEINQCSNNWSKIDFNKVTSISLNKQTNSFLNNNKSIQEDRLICEENFKKYIKEIQTNDKDIKGKKISLNEFTKNALNIIKEKNKNNGIYNEKLLLKKDLLNLQWNNYSKDINNLGNIIPIIDLSSSMAGEPLNTAISLGILVAEKSILHKRIMILTSNPKWIILTEKNNFVDYVEEIINCEYELNTNFYSIIDIFLNSIIDSKMDETSISEMKIIIFSDMQVDNLNNIHDTIYEKIKKKYIDIGLKIYKKPIEIPKIIFWNLRSTNGFPSLSCQHNVSMLSGFNACFLNLFWKKSLNISKENTSFSLLKKILSNKRYNILENKAREVLCNYDVY